MPFKRLTGVPRIAVITGSFIVAVSAATFPFVFAKVPEKASAVAQLPVTTNSRPSFMAGRHSGFGQNEYGSFVEPFGRYGFVETSEDPLGMSAIPDFSRASIAASPTSASSDSGFKPFPNDSSSSNTFRSSSGLGSRSNGAGSRDLCGDQEWNLPFMIGRDPLGLCILDVGPDDTGVFGPFGF